MASEGTSSRAKNIRVKVKYFAHARTFTNLKEEMFSFDEPTSLNDLLSKVEEAYPKISEMRPLIVIVNGIMSEVDRKISDGDTIALVPPLGGG